MIKFSSCSHARENWTSWRGSLRCNSIGANYREANRGVSRADFANKIGTVQKEAAETQYWLELLIESNLCPNQAAATLQEESSELLASLPSSRENIESMINNPQFSTFYFTSFYFLHDSILGLNAYHGDSAACLFVDGKLIAAAEEERFRRIKHWAGLPTQAIDYCLREGGLTINEIDHIAVNRKPGVNNLRRFLFVLRHRPDPRLMWQKVRNIRKAATVKEALEAHYGTSLRAKSHHIEHHHAHLASAFLVSGFEEAACLSVDGFGDFASTSFGLGHANGIEIQDRVYFPHSLGIFFSAVTQFIGFPHYGDEYKVMGLAPYGEPKFVRQMSGLVEIANNGKFKLDLRYFRHHTANVSYSWNNCAPEVGKLYRDEMAELLGPPRDPDAPLEQRHKDLARSAQIVYEEAFFALLLALHRRYPVPNLALSGGCAMNSVANGKVYLRTPFRKMYLPAAAGDAGGAIGAACVVAAKLEIRKSEGVNLEREKPAEISTLAFRPSPLCSAYLGPHFSNDEIEHLLRCTRLALIFACRAGIPACRSNRMASETRLHLRAPASPLGISPLVGLPAEPIDPRQAGALALQFQSSRPAHRRRRRTLPTHRARDHRRPRRRLVSGANGMGPPRAGESFHSMRPAARRYERHFERQD